MLGALSRTSLARWEFVVGQDGAYLRPGAFVSCTQNLKAGINISCDAGAGESSSRSKERTPRERCRRPANYVKGTAFEVGRHRPSARPAPLLRGPLFKFTWP